MQDEITRFYLNYYSQLLGKLRHGQEASIENERDAQKQAIKETILYFFKKYPAMDKGVMWNYIYSAHVGRKSGIETSRATIEKVISADQSWKKSSGHAFEEAVKYLCNKRLQPDGFSVMLQRDVKTFINNSIIRNEEPDKEWLISQCRASSFDMFIEKGGCIFGFLQVKTSIRDRVTRDREPSILAMGRYFWSAIFVLDGDFLRLPKFNHMVNGGGDEFKMNGWHGLYGFSIPKKAIEGRIYLLDGNMQPFVEHAKKAFIEWKERRQWFTRDWKVS